MAEQISFMPFYYVQDVQQKNQLRTRLEKRPDKINRKVNVASISGAGGGGGGGALNPSCGGFRHPAKIFRL